MSYTEQVRAELAETMHALSLEVDRGNVLQARAVILAEAKHLQDAIGKQMSAEGVGLCSDDPLSPYAAAAFNEKIQAYYGQCLVYAEELERAAHALDEVARRYGFTEEQIAASFAGRGG